MYTESHHKKSENDYNPITLKTLTQKNFEQLSEYIYTNLGIKLSPVKKTMLQARLQKRLRALRFSSFDEYCNYLFSPEGPDEEIFFINVITTNKTDFFREPAHFEYLKQFGFTHIIEDLKKEGRRNIKIWSAGCSTGEEPYTLAMVANEYIENSAHWRGSFSIFATDISTEVLNTSIRAVYHKDRITGLPLNLKQKYFHKNKNHEKPVVKIVPELRKFVSFQQLNFMNDRFAIDKEFDIIFCRNVMIYFDEDKRQQLIIKFCNHLREGGFLFIGHSESIRGINVPLIQIRPTIYQKSIRK